MATGTRTIVLSPRGNATPLDYVPTGLTNWINVQDGSDATYNSDGVTGHADLFYFNTLPVEALSITNIDLILRAKHDAASGTYVVNAAYNPGGGLDILGADCVVTTAFANYPQLAVDEPDVGGPAWSLSAFNNTIWGYRTGAIAVGGKKINVSEINLNVTYLYDLSTDPGSGPGPAGGEGGGEGSPPTNAPTTVHEGRYYKVHVVQPKARR